MADRSPPAGTRNLSLIYDVVIAGAGPVGLFLACELRLAEVLKEDLKIEPQKERWMPLWGLPVH